MTWTSDGLPLAEARQGALLVGNGPNRLSPGHSWGELLEQLKAAVGLRRPAARDQEKPFPLLYEELFLHGARSRGVRERDLKGLIAAHTAAMVPNGVHEELLTLPVPHLLTTNYDHVLERALGAGPGPLRNRGPVREQRYSLFRRVDLAGRHLWHIHGDQAVTRSIMLGYEHYSGCLERMRSYVTGQATYQGKALPGLVRRLRDGEGRLRSWVDLFFTADLWILGLDLDVAELNLWWLLTYRARLAVRTPGRVSGRIVYLHPARRAGPTDRERRKLELLAATGVEVVSLALEGRNGVDYRGYYSRAIRAVRKGLAR